MKTMKWRYYIDREDDIWKWSEDFTKSILYTRDLDEWGSEDDHTKDYNNNFESIRESYDLIEISEEQVFLEMV
jgi:hypothetical protein